MKTEQELRQLDVWIAEHVMRLVKKPAGRCAHANEDFCIHDRVLIFQGEKKCLRPFQPTTDPAAAMEILKKCMDFSANQIVIWRQKGTYKITMAHWNGGASIEAPTLELAICLFAKKLFSN